MLRFTIADYSIDNIAVVRLAEIDNQLYPEYSDSWRNHLKAKELLVLPEGRMAAYLPDLVEFLTLHNLDYEINE